MPLRSILSDCQVERLFRILYIPYMLRDFFFCCWKGLKWDRNFRFYGLPCIRIGGKGSSITVGKRFVACSDLSHNAIGVFQKVIIKTVGHGAKIIIGDDVGISGCTISAATSVRIGNHVLLGSGCLITDSDSHPIDPDERRLGGGGLSKSIIIEDDVFVGARAIILKGVTIGKGSVVGAGAVVVKSVPPYSIVAGNPAKVVGDSRRRAKV